MIRAATSMPCPDCGALLRVFGFMQLSEDEIVPVYLCEVCTITVEFCGERLKACASFWVDGEGNVVRAEAER